MKLVLILLLLFAISCNPKKTQRMLKKAFSSLPKKEGVLEFLNRLCTHHRMDNYPVHHKYMADVNSMNFQYMTPCKNYTTPLKEAEKLWEIADFKKRVKENKQLQIVVLAMGWKNSLNKSRTLRLLSAAFLCRKDVAFIVVDVAHYLHTPYNWAALNTKQIGRHIGEGLAKLEKVIPLENIHLVGHSLGAHVMGAAGRRFFEMTGCRIPRITGLDPAKPCFRKGSRWLNSLQRGDAEFVDIIHSNVGVLGKKNPIGDLDFYPGGTDRLPPGCKDDTCAHSRAVEYFAESAYPGNDKSFVGYKCETFHDLVDFECSSQHTAEMGYVENRRFSGIYYVPVAEQAPYAIRAAPSFKGIENAECNKCVIKTSSKGCFH